MIKIIILFIIIEISKGNEYSNNRLETVKSLLYEPLDATAAYLLLNNNEMIGTFIKEKKVFGKPIDLSTQQKINEFDWKTKGILVLPDSLLTGENLQLFEEKNVVGVVFYDAHEKNYVSQDHPTSFNPNASGIAWKRYTYPIMYTSLSKQEILKEGKYLQIDMDMYADENSEVCLRRGMCLPIGGHSLIGSLGNTTHTESILLSCQMDGVSFFRDLTPSHEQIVSGEVVLLAVLETLRPVIDKAKKNLHFGFFEGETFGSMGSSTYAKDHDNYTSIYHFGPMGKTQGYVFVYTQSELQLDPTKRVVLLDTIQPPNSSLDSFTHGKKFYVADHRENYKGNIGTHKDVLEELNELCENVQSVTELILRELFDRDDVDQLETELGIEYKCHNFSQLFTCLGHQLDCEYFNETIGSISGSSNGYPSVYRSSQVTTRTYAIRHYLHYITTMNVCENDCTSHGNGTVEYMSTYGSDIEFTALSYNVNHDKGNAWTESTWSIVKLSHYSSQTSSDIIFCCLGFVVMIVLVIITFKILFKFNLL